MRSRSRLLVGLGGTLLIISMALSVTAQSGQQDPMAQDPMAQDPMAQDPMAQDPNAQGAPTAAPQPPPYVPPPVPRPQVAPGSASFSMLSPYAVAARSRQLLDTAVLRLSLELDYSEDDADARQSRTAGLSGVLASRMLAKKTAGAGARTLELALSSYPAGGYQLYVHGLETDGVGSGPNPDLRAAESILQNLLGELTRAQSQKVPAKFGDPGSRFTSYKLSYVQADRATALLKVLGYSVVEFTPPAGAQMLVYDQVFGSNPPAANLPLPVVIRLIDSEKTSLLQPVPAAGGRGAPAPRGGRGGAGDGLNLGGLFLDRITAGAPQQRLMIVYDGNDPQPMQVLLNLLREEIDIPAQQILIEALVIELDQDKLRDLGVDFEGSKDGSAFSFITDNAGFASPFTYSFTRPSLKTLFDFNVTLKALVTRGTAQVLSRPSVLVLDGRQARIQVGEKIPYTSNISATNTGTLSSTDYLTTGIVLNLRPRISEDGSEITMQVETLISSAGQGGVIAETGVLVAPPIQSREVQTLVRVANNTPFVIGGLISTTQQTNVSGIPGLSKIPGLGALFRKETKTDDKREVIVVITPHVVPADDRTFSYAIPKDSNIFDSFGKEFFRNVYRIQASDIFDLTFVYESQVLRDMVARVDLQSEAEPRMLTDEPFRSLLRGGVPGEEILVRRMLWEVVRKKGFIDMIDPKKIFFFAETGDGQGLDVSFLGPVMDSKETNGLALAFERATTTTMERPFDPPRAKIGFETVTAEGYLPRLREGNHRRPDGTWQKSTILIDDAYTGTSGQSSRDMLMGVLVLKRLLELNTDLPLTLEGFHVGVEVVFPTEKDLRQRFHLVDRKAAELFYEIADYYLAFEQEFTRRTRLIVDELGGGL
ncbi:MAG: type II secretion system protein GspD [bacterium]|nr:type II secretion system protein GspD [bacterium]